MGKIRLKYKPYRRYGNVGDGVSMLHPYVCPNWIRQRDAIELRQVIQEAARDGIKSQKAWDAYMFRVAQLREKFTANDISLLFDAFATVKRNVPTFFDVILQQARDKVFQFSIRDSAIMLNALAKLRRMETDLATAMQANLLQKIKDHNQDRDLALLAFTYVRLGDIPNKELVLDRIIAILTPRIHRCRSGQSLTMLAHAFASSGEPGQKYNEECRAPHSGFLKLVLEQCCHKMKNFSSADVMYTVLTLEKLEARGDCLDVSPADLVYRMQSRSAVIMHEFKPAEFAKMFEGLHSIHGIAPQFRNKVRGEIAYRIRSFDPRPCLDFLTITRKYDDILIEEPYHPQFESALYFRLSAPDSLKAFNQSEAAHLSKLVMHSKIPPTWEAKEAMLCLLPNLRREKHLESTAFTLSIYAKLGIRDTPFAHALAKVAPFLPEAATSTLGQICFGLARLGMPTVSDDIDLWPVIGRVSMRAWSENIDAAAQVLAAAGLFCMARPPENLVCEGVMPALGAVAQLLETNPKKLDELLISMPGLSFFLFTPLAEQIAAGSEMHETAVASLRERALHHIAEAQTTGSYSESAATSHLSASVRSFMIGCDGAKFDSDVLVGPVRVPFAVDIVTLAGSLRSLPLFDDDGYGQEEEEEDENGEEEEEAEEQGECEVENEEGGEENEEIEAKIKPSSDLSSSSSTEQPRGRMSGGRKSSRIARYAASMAMQHDAADLAFDDPTVAPSESQSSKPVPKYPGGVIKNGNVGSVAGFLERRSRNIPSKVSYEESDEDVPTLDSGANARTHALVYLLTADDFYHESDRIRSVAQRSKGKIVCARAFAELNMLRGMGWRVISLAEHQWTGGSSAQARKENGRYTLQLLAHLAH